jgi:hypothetical protein
VQSNPYQPQKGNTMQCANPKCRRDALDLQTGTLCLIELSLPPDERIIRADGGFPVAVAPSRYFWLCPECSRIWKMKRWTSAGVDLEPNRQDWRQTQEAQAEKIAPAREGFRPQRQVLPHLVA